MKESKRIKKDGGKAPAITSEAVAFCRKHASIFALRYYVIQAA
jgi:hypothetical protein